MPLALGDIIEGVLRGLAAGSKVIWGSEKPKQFNVKEDKPNVTDDSDAELVDDLRRLRRSQNNAGSNNGN